MHRQKKNPSEFYRTHTSHKIDEDRLRHFKEHVIEAIPFHKKILEQNKKKLEVITSIMPKKKYKKIMNISMIQRGTPEYIVFDKVTKKYFFVCEEQDSEKDNWIKKSKKIVDIVVVD